MIDMHTHILPDLDDGAKNDNEMTALIRAEILNGVREIVFTPHCYAQKQPIQCFLKRRAAVMERVRPLLPAGIKTRVGAEVRLLGVNDPTNDALCSLAIEGTRCVLVELPFTGKWNGALLVKLFRFIADTGHQPIIAHIERYEQIRRKPTLVNTLVKMGCLIQLNTGAFLDKHTQKFAFCLLRHGLVHCFGTDAHNCEDRPSNYKEAKDFVKEKGCKKEWAQVQARMRQILKNQKVENACVPIKKLFWWYK